MTSADWHVDARVWYVRARSKSTGSKLYADRPGVTERAATRTWGTTPRCRCGALDSGSPRSPGITVGTWSLPSGTAARYLAVPIGRPGGPPCRVLSGLGRVRASHNLPKRVGRLLRRKGRSLAREVPAAVVHALFHNFADGEVARHIPCIGHGHPPGANAARERGSVAPLRWILGGLAHNPGVARAADLPHHQQGGNQRPDGGTGPLRRECGRCPCPPDGGVALARSQPAPRAQGEGGTTSPTDGLETARTARDCGGRRSTLARGRQPGQRPLPRRDPRPALVIE